METKNDLFSNLDLENGFPKSFYGANHVFNKGPHEIQSGISN